jgi:hypothetical protein
MSKQPYSRLLFAGGLVAALVSLVFAGFHAGRTSVRPSTVAQPAGIVCRSAHFTLTAEIHAGS